jgi:hypothetical protein
MRSHTVINVDEKFLPPTKPGDLNYQAKKLSASQMSDAIETPYTSVLPVDTDSDRALRAGRSRQRVNTELDAAIALHKADIPCKVRKSVVCAVKGWSRPTLYRRIADEKFPKPVKDGRYSWWWIADVLDDP